ncbi:MAG TPA: hypothetical protein VMF68_11770 [Spirochaetia bacterium]|nr:hypothetical protein [Spirochaetia bacterium]HTZ52333.1 hypothetical protein [Spirochaetia bacterium]
MRSLRRSARGRCLAFAVLVLATVLLLGASPRPGRQNQAMLPVLVLARLRLYGKVPVQY